MQNRQELVGCAKKLKNMFPKFQKIGIFSLVTSRCRHQETQPKSIVCNGIERWLRSLCLTLVLMRTD